jgi:hypothetical protein
MITIMAETTNLPPSDPGGSRPHHERRREVRYDISPGRAAILVGNIQGDPFPARVRNISTGGICLMSNTPHEPGSILDVNLCNLNRNAVRHVQVQVLYQMEHPSGDWMVGGAFARKLTGEELRGLL